MRTLSAARLRATIIRSTAAALCVAGTLASAPSAVADPSVKATLSLLPTLANPGHAYSSARAISGNGQVVVGVSTSPDTYEGSNGFHAVRWNSQLQIVDIGSIGGNPRNEAEANAVSFDGSVIAGGSTTEPLTSGSIGTPMHAFVFTSSGNEGGAGVFTDLGSLAGSYGYSNAFGLSGDGKVVVGESDVNLDCECSGATHAFRWTKATGMLDLGTLQGDFGTSAAYGANADGSLTVGASSFSPYSGGISPALGARGGRSALYGYGVTHAVYWNGLSGPVDLGSLAGAFGNSSAAAVNSQGTAQNARIVGASDVNDFESESTFSHAALWTLTNGAVTATDLGTIENYAGNSAAKAISAAGNIIVGNSDTASGQHAFRWSQLERMADLNTLLTNAGVNLGTMVLTEANGVSADGQFIVGTATPNTPSDFRKASAALPTAAALAAPPPPVTQGYIARYVSAGNIGGVTTVGSVQGSVDDIGGSRVGQIVTTRVLTSVLQGVNEQVNCSNCISAFGAVGSFSAGVHGRYSLSDRLTFLAGAAFAQFKQDGADVTSAPILAAALRYDFTDWGASRPFFEAGATAAPSEKVRYTRTYANGAGTATGVGDTRADNYAVYGRLGWVYRLSPIDELAAAGEIWSGWQHVRGYQETFSQQNPFEAKVLGGTDRMNLVKIGGQWTHLFGSSIEFNLNGGVVRSFGTKSGVNAEIPGFGLLTPLIKDQTWVEAGARVGYRFNKFAIVDLFANGSSGEKPVGTHVHGGLGLRLNF